MTTTDSTITDTPPCPAWCKRATEGHEDTGTTEDGDRWRDHHADGAVQVGDDFGAWIGAHEIIRGGVSEWVGPHVCIESQAAPFTAAEARRISVGLAALADRLDDITRATATSPAGLDWETMSAAGLDVMRVQRDETNPGLYLSSGRGGVRVCFGVQPDREKVCRPGQHTGWSSQTSRPVDDGSVETDASMWFEPGNLHGLLEHVRGELRHQ